MHYCPLYAYNEAIHRQRRREEATSNGVQLKGTTMRELPSTHIHKITLENFRLFSEREIHFNPRLTVIVGINGTGKSTVLDAVSACLSLVINRITNKTARVKAIGELDIREGQHRASLRCQIESRQSRSEFSIAKAQRGFPAVKSELAEATSLAEAIASEYQKRENGATGLSLPVFVAYPIHRAVLDIPLRIRTKHSFGMLECYDNALEATTAFRLFFEWFRKQEDVENEALASKQRQGTTDPYVDPALEAVRKALETFLPGFSNFRIRRQGLAFLVDKGDTTLRVDQLSDGEKNMIGLIGDLARRLAVANPDSPSPLHGEGIVLIDELELHLHPKWQQDLIPKLLSTFPNIQFIVSTHSPQVLTSVKAENILLLHPDGTTEVATSSWGMTAGEILTELMDARELPPEFVEKLEAISALVSKQDFSKAEELLGALKLEVKTNTQALVHAERTLAYRKAFP